MGSMKYQMLFRGGPIDGLNVTWPYETPPDVLRGFITNSPANLTIPPVGSKELLEYYRQDIFVCDVAPEVRAVIYVFKKK